MSLELQLVYFESPVSSKIALPVWSKVFINQYRNGDIKNMCLVLSLAWCIFYGPDQTGNENKKRSETSDQIYTLM